MSLLRVLAIGSCRIFRPLRAAHEKGRLELVNKDEKWWFTHTPGGARQYVEALGGYRDIPEKYRGLTCETVISPLPTSLVERKMLDVDVVIVEVSAMRQLWLDDIVLNQQMVWGYVNQLGVPTGPVMWGDVSELPDGDQLKPLRVSRVTTDLMREDLLRIQEAARSPVATVDHLYALMSTGEIAPDRMAITDGLSEIERTSGLPFWSTKDILLDGGQELLEDQNHWAKAAEEAVAERLVSHLEGAVGHQA